MNKAISIILFLSQGILRSNSIETSSDVHIRQKRVTGGELRHRDEAPFLITILLRGNFHAPASLLTADTAITSAHVFKNLDQSLMTLESRRTYGTNVHQIVGLIFLNPQYNEAHPTFKNLALVKFAPPIHFPPSVNRPISIYNGSIVEEHLRYQFINWGRVVSPHYRTIPVQLMSIEHCQQIYPGLIGPGNICTNGVNLRQHGTDRDSGAPLIVEQHLLGIMVFHGNGRGMPDVFMNLLDHDIKRWIHEHVPSLNLF